MRRAGPAPPVGAQHGQGAGGGDPAQPAAGVAIRIVEGAVEQAVPVLGGHWNLAVVDPPRDGLGVEGVAAVTTGHPRTIAYVSCDPASLARDSRYLAERGYRLEWATPVDLFPQTFHIETVAAFEAH